jgi:hypothetical protein
MLEECLRYNTTSNGHGWRNEESHKSATRRHGGVVCALGASNITHTAKKQGQKENRASTKAVGKWFPEQRGASQDGNLQGCEITDSLNRNLQIFGNILVSTNDGCGSESTHASMERNKT